MQKSQLSQSENLRHHHLIHHWIQLSDKLAKILNKIHIEPNHLSDRWTQNIIAVPQWSHKSLTWQRNVLPLPPRGGGGTC